MLNYTVFWFGNFSLARDSSNSELHHYSNSLETGETDLSQQVRSAALPYVNPIPTRNLHQKIVQK
jgi:hypothetical protein